MTSKISTVIRYDGPALKESSMDVADLAPALWGLSEIVKIANKKINGDRSAVKVLVKVDIEQKCFQFLIEITQTLVQQISLFVSDEKVATAKEIAEWIGLVGGSGGGGYGLLKFYKWMAKKKLTLNELSIEEHGDNISISNVEGDVTVNKNTFFLLNDEEILKNVKNVVKPLTKDGYDKLQFEQNDEIVDEISSEDGEGIYNITEDFFKSGHRVNKSITSAKIQVKKPDYLGNSKWSFVLDKGFEAKIEDTSWLERFQRNEISIPAGSFLEVILRTEIELDDNNDPTGIVSYYIVEIKRVILPTEQTDLFKQ